MSAEANLSTIMFGILNDSAQPEKPYELIYFDLLSEAESEKEFQKLYNLEVVFNGYFPWDHETPDGLNVQIHERISAVVQRLNQGEQLSTEQIREILAPILV